MNENPLLHDWFRAWLDQYKETSLFYCKSAEIQIMFVRDILPGAWKGRQDSVRVVGEHRSKSVRLPVYRAQIAPSLQITFRDNFHDWKVSVNNDAALDIDPRGLFDSESDYLINPVYFEGFDRDDVYSTYGESDRKQFSLALRHREQLWALCLLLWRATHD